MELTPRKPEARSRRSTFWPRLAIAGVVVAIGMVAVQGINNAAVYFYNVDEAVAMRDELGDRRFRLQGTVVDGSIERAEGGAEFEVAFNGERAAVRHAGSTPEMFQPGIPVVIEGQWSDADPVFESDRILVKHSEEYEAEHEDRLDDAEEGEATAGSDAGPGA
jgi:cytochrome c-type biogenesis protein CcmE